MADLYDIGSTVRLSAGESTASGTGARGITGQGILTAAAASVVAQGFKTIKEVSAVLTARPASVVASGFKTIVGVSAVLSAAACTMYGRDVEGDGDIHDIGSTVSLSAGIAELTGDGEKGLSRITGFGNLYCEPITMFASTGAIYDVGSTQSWNAGQASVGASGGIGEEIEDIGEPAQLLAQPATMVAQGFYQPYGAAVLWASLATMTGVGAKGIGGAGVLNAQRASMAAEGPVQITGAGLLSVRLATLVGSSQKGIQGIGILSAAEANVFGNGTDSTLGIGILNAGPATLQGIGFKAKTGTGTLDAGPASLTGYGFVATSGGVMFPYDHTAGVPSVGEFNGPRTAMEFPAAVGFGSIYRATLDLVEFGFLKNERVLVMAPDNSTEICTLSHNRDQVEIEPGDAALGVLQTAVLSGQPINLYLAAYRIGLGGATSVPINRPVSIRLQISGVAA